MQDLVQPAREVAGAAAQIDDAHGRRRLDEREEIEKRLLPLLLKLFVLSVDSMYPYALSSTAIKDASRPAVSGSGDVVWKRQAMALHGRARSRRRRCARSPPEVGLAGPRPRSSSAGCSARATTSAVSRVGGAVWLRVTVVKSEYRTLTVTVRANSCRRSSQPAACSAISVTSRRMISRSVRSVG